MTAHKMDVTKQAEWNAIVEKAFSAHGRLDILVNNAGTTYKNKVGRYYLSTY